MFNFFAAKKERDNFSEKVERLFKALGNKRFRNIKEFDFIGESNVKNGLQRVSASFKSLTKYWERGAFNGVTRIPPSKILRDFNKYLFSQERTLNQIEVLAYGIYWSCHYPPKSDDELKYIDDLLEFYKNKLNEFEREKGDIFKINNEILSIGRVKQNLFLFANCFCFRLIQGKDSVYSEKIIEGFVERQIENWGLKYPSHENFSELTWGITWFIDIPNSEENFSIAELKRKKLGTHSDFFKAEVSALTGGNFIFTDLLTNEEKIIEKDEFPLGDDEMQISRYRYRCSTYINRYDNFFIAHKDKESYFLKTLENSKYPELKLSELTNIINLEREIFDEALSKMSNKEIFTHQVFQYVTAVIIAECLNRYLTIFIRQEKIKNEENIGKYYAKLNILSSAIIGYFVNFNREFFSFDYEHKEFLDPILCKELSKETNYMKEMANEESVLPSRILWENFPEEFEKAIKHLREFNIQCNFLNVVGTYQGKSVDLQSNDFNVFISNFDNDWIY